MGSLATLSIWAYVVFKWFTQYPGEFDGEQGLFFPVITILGLVIGILIFFIFSLIFSIKNSGRTSHKFFKIILIIIGFILLISFFVDWGNL